MDADYGKHLKGNNGTKLQQAIYKSLQELALLLLQKYATGQI